MSVYLSLFARRERVDREEIMKNNWENEMRMNKEVA